MKTITIKTCKSGALHEWMAKEYGSWEDYNKASDHAYSLLCRFGGKVTLTEEEAKTILISGDYQSTGWNDDEIQGGARTKQVIANYCRKIRNALKSS